MNYIIFDTDLGIDDGLAFICLLELTLRNPNAILLGVTTVFGNIDNKKSVNNVLALSEHAGLKIDVYDGNHEPLEQEKILHPTHIHGEDGFGNQWLRAKGNAKSMHAVDFICQSINKYPNQVNIIAVGPLTNIAEAILKDSTIINKINKLIIMGGAYRVKGNITDVAEANVQNDRLAAKIVIESQIPKILIGLDVTTTQILFKKDQIKIRNIDPICLGEEIYQALRFYSAFHLKTAGFDGCYLHDVQAVFYLFYPHLYEKEYKNVFVDEESGDTILHQGNNSIIVTAVHTCDFFDVFFHTLNRIHCSKI